MKLKLTWLLTLFMAFVMQFSFAQEKMVTGTVTTESDGLPLPGANVIVKGTTKGAQTDFDGKYTIGVNTGDVLVISYVGMEPVEVTVGASNVYDVALKEGNTLDEVVVVGYSTTTKESFTGTAAVVDMESVEDKVVANVTQALRGEIAGVNVISRTGAPGASAEIRIRGFGSINGNSLPLYIIDGAPLTDNDGSFGNYGVLSSINPADIENITVLKDAAATSIYGSRGANGVIIITTKRGKAGSSKITVDLSTSVNALFLPNYEVIESPEEYIELSWQALRNKGILTGQADPASWASDNLYGDPGVVFDAIDPLYNIWNVPGNQLINPATGKFNEGVQRRFNPTKWSDVAIGTGLRTEANLQFNGGTEKTTFLTSFGYVDDEGYALNSNFTRYSARINLQHQAKDWLRVGGNISYSAARALRSSPSEGNSSGRSSGDIFDLLNTVPAIYDIYLRDQDGNRIPDPIFGGFQFDYGNETGRRAWNGTNGIADAIYDLSRRDYSTLLGTFNINADITDWLSFEARYSGQLQTTDIINRRNGFYGGVADAGGSLTVTDTKSINQNFLQLLRFNKNFGENNLELFVAHESTEDRYEVFSGSAQTAIDPSSVDLNQYTTGIGRAETFTQGWTLDSYFAQLNYNYSGKYFLTGSIRRDGSSRFLNDKWGTFGSVGLGWVVTKEDFMASSNFFDFLKLKGSYGVIGDPGTGLQYGWQLLDINQTVDGSYSFTPVNTLGNPDLTWETSKIWQVGFESRFLNDKISLDVDYYNKRTTNLFFTENLAPSSGFQFRTYNSGELQNSGLEFNINAKVIESDNFRLSLGLNGETFENKIIEMPTVPGSTTPEVFDDFSNLAKGKSDFDWFMREWAGVNPANGEALWYLYYDDINGDGVFDAGDNQIANMVTYLDENPDANVARTTTNTYGDATQKFVGKSAIPDVRGGFRLNASYKNFDLSTQFSYSIGGYAYDFGYAVLMDNSLIGTDNYSTDIRNAWNTPGQITDVPRMSALGSPQDANQNRTSTRFLTKADYLALNNISLSYRFNADILDSMGLNNLSIFVSGDNLMMLSARKGLNPTTFTGSSNAGLYTPLSTFTAGVKIEF